MEYVVTRRNHDDDEYLEHKGVKGMKWGYSDGKRTGKRTAAELDAVQKLRQKSGTAGKDIQADYDNANGMLKYLGISLDLHSDDAAVAKTMDVVDQMEAAKGTYKTQFDYLNAYMDKLAAVGYDMSAAKAFVAQNRDKFESIKPASNKDIDAGKSAEKADGTTSASTTTKEKKKAEKTSKKDKESKDSKKDEKTSSTSTDKKTETKKEEVKKTSVTAKSYGGRAAEKTTVANALKKAAKKKVTTKTSSTSTKKTTVANALKKAAKKKVTTKTSSTSTKKTSSTSTKKSTGTTVILNKNKPVVVKHSAEIQNEEHLQHHGVLGMKWGVRRYQNKDGSYTNAGKKHRKKMDQATVDKIKKGVAIGAGVAAAAGLAYLGYKTGAPDKMLDLLTTFAANHKDAVKTALKKTGKTALNTVKDSLKKTGKAMTDAALVSIGTIKIAELSRKLETGPNASQAEKDRNKLILDTASAGIRTMTKPGSVSTGNGTSQKNGRNIGAEITSSIGQPSGKGVNKQSQDWNGLFNNQTVRNNPDVKANIKSMASAGYDINQIKDYIDKFAHSDYSDFIITGQKYLGLIL